MVSKKRRVKRIPKLDGQCSMAVPENFHSGYLLSDLNKKENKKLRLKDQFFYILNTIISLSTQKRYEDNSFYPVDSQILNNVCGKCYAEAIGLLIKHEVIDSDNSYVVGQKVKGYRLIGKYAAAEIIYKELNDPTIRKNYLSYKKRNDEINDKALLSIPYIVKWFDKGRLTINEGKCHQFIEFYGKEMQNEFKKSKPDLYKDRFVNNRIAQKMNNAINSVTKFAKGDFTLTRTGKDNRLHNPVAGIKKEFRNFISFDDQPLIGIDITTSQPYLLTTLFNLDFYKNKINGLNLRSIYPQLNQQISKEGQLHDLQHIIMYGNNIETISNEDIGYFNFRTNDWTKDFYTLFMHEVERRNPSNKKNSSTRSAIKKQMMFILYDKKGGNRDYFKKFENIFPVEGQLITFFNSIAGANYLPILLQRIESNLVLDEVCKNIAIKHPDAPLLPAHDCIYTTPKFAGVVESEMRETLKKLTGYIPGLKVESTDEQVVLQNLRNIAHDELSDILKSYKKVKKKMRAATQMEKPINLKKPLILTMPNLFDKSIISSRYVDADKVDYHFQNDYPDTL